MKRNSLEEFVKFLKAEGVKNVKLNTIPKEGGQGEFYVFQVLKGNEVPIFSNNKTIHPSAAIGFALKPNRFAEVKAKLVI